MMIPFRLVFLLAFFLAPLLARNVESPFNHRLLHSSETAADYSFLLVGHPYGAARTSSIYPSASLLANIDLLNDTRASFLILLGDIVQRPNRLEYDTLRNSLLSKLAFPVFNAPGNHELYQRELYTRLFGPTYSAFVHASELFLLLDSWVLDVGGDITPAQLQFILDHLEFAANSRQIRNIFLFSHHLLWAVENPPYSCLIPLTNVPAHHPQSAIRISRHVLPRLRALRDKRIYLISGDLSRHPFFYHEDPGSTLVYAATAVSDGPRDGFLQVTVRNGEVTIIPISLTGENPAPIQHYNLEYWTRDANRSGEAREPFLSSFPSRVWQLTRHHYFRVGVFLGAVAALLLSSLARIVLRVVRTPN